MQQLGNQMTAQQFKMAARGKFNVRVKKGDNNTRRKFKIFFSRVVKYGIIKRFAAFGSVLYGFFVD